ncbi:hypothetical protein [Aeromicrobium sp. NPDC092404]|uniref:hypothetical protein n=1 Tax=Aeromicrobium sp. NPDC092404 TaxID=3154976 RepID=UPI003432DFE8
MVTVLTIVVATVLLCALATLAVVALLRRVAAAPPSGRRQEPVQSGRVEWVGAQIVSSRTINSTAADRGVAIVELRLDLGSGVVRSVTWQVELSATSRLEPGQTITVGWDASSESVWPIEDWARRWPQ